MLTPDTDITRANRIARTIATEGWRDIRQTLENRIQNLTKKIVETESDIVIEKVEHIKGKGIQMNIVNISKDYNKHEIKVLILFLKEIEKWVNLAKEVR